MSRAYRIKLSQKLDKIIRAEDHVSTELELLNILPADQMGQLLGQELEKQGFERKGKSAHRTDGAITISVDLETGKVIAKIESSEEVNLKSEQSGRYYDDAPGDKERAEKAVRKQLKEDLDREVNQKTNELQEKLTDQLEGQLSNIRKDLDQAINRATAEALKQKAAQIGQIKELTEDPESGSLTIVLEV